MEIHLNSTAAALARIVVRNALFLGRQRMSALTILWRTCTDPEVAHVGMYVEESRRPRVRPSGKRRMPVCARGCHRSLSSWRADGCIVDADVFDVELVMMIDSAEFHVRQGEIVQLARRPTTSAPLCKSTSTMPRA